MLIVGGAPRLLALNKNHQIVKAGKIFINPLIRFRFRVNEVSYVMFARANKAEEISPWAIISIRAPLHPHRFKVRIPAVARPICLIEEYAISAFMSV